MHVNKAEPNNPLREIIKFGGYGILIGFLIIAIIEIKINYTNIMSIRQVIMAHLNSTSETEYLLAKAKYKGLRGENQETINILSPNINKFTDRFEAAEAYLLLGTAEYQLGHPLLAAGYFERMYANNPTSKNLYLLGLAYDSGGNMDMAVEKLSIAIALNDGTMQPEEIAYAQQLIQDIVSIKNPKP